MITDYKQLLLKQCEPIVQEVLKEMESNRIFVGRGEKIQTEEPILYRWWFPISIAKEIQDAYQRDTKQTEDILANVESRPLKDENIYCALYFGKSINGRRRFLQHTTKSIKTSTLRRTIFGLYAVGKDEKEKEEHVTDVLNRCYCDWVALPDKHLLECLESLCIALGHYPLNIDGNQSISDEWRKYLSDKRRCTML